MKLIKKKSLTSSQYPLRKIAKSLSLTSTGKLTTWLLKRWRLLALETSTEKRKRKSYSKRNNSSWNEASTWSKTPLKNWSCFLTQK
jgi:hypothetical protein